jgi:hypothetical protein
LRSVVFFFGSSPISLLILFGETWQGSGRKGRLRRKPRPDMASLNSPGRASANIPTLSPSTKWQMIPLLMVDLGIELGLKIQAPCGKIFTMELKDRNFQPQKIRPPCFGDEGKFVSYLEDQAAACECSRCPHENDCGEFILMKCSRELTF